MRTLDSGVCVFVGAVEVGVAPGVGVSVSCVGLGFKLGVWVSPGCVGLGFKLGVCVLASCGRVGPILIVCVSVSCVPGRSEQPTAKKAQTSLTENQRSVNLGCLYTVPLKQV